MAGGQILLDGAQVRQADILHHQEQQQQQQQRHQGAPATAVHHRQASQTQVWCYAQLKIFKIFKNI